MIKSVAFAGRPIFWKEKSAGEMGNCITKHVINPSALNQTISTNGNYSYIVKMGEKEMRSVFFGTGARNFCAVRYDDIAKNKID
jgi:hypothetical protein